MKKYLGKHFRELNLTVYICVSISLSTGLWKKINILAGGFKYFLCSPLPGEVIQFD